MTTVETKTPRTIADAASWLAEQQRGNGPGKPGSLAEAARRLAAQQLAAAGRSEQGR